MLYTYPLINFKIKLIIGNLKFQLRYTDIN